MDFVKLFFSFRGRVSRAGYWFVSITWGVVTAVLEYAWTESGASDIPLGRNHLLDVALAAFVLASIVSCAAVGAARLHDRNRSAGLLIVFYCLPPAIETLAMAADLGSGLTVALMVLSGVIAIWAIVELGCLRGTIGANAYGPDPLADDAWRSA